MRDYSSTSSPVSPQASRGAYDPTAFARKKQAAMENATKLRNRRKEGVLDDDCTFTPKVISKYKKAPPSDKFDDIGSLCQTQDPMFNGDALDQISKRHDHIKKYSPREDEEDLPPAQTNQELEQKVGDSLSKEYKRLSGQGLPSTKPKATGNGQACLRNSTCRCPQCTWGESPAVQQPQQVNVTTERPSSIPLNPESKRISYSAQSSHGVGQLEEMESKEKGLSLLKSKIRSRRKPQSAPGNSQSSLQEETGNPSAPSTPRKSNRPGRHAAANPPPGSALDVSAPSSSNLTLYAIPTSENEVQDDAAFNKCDLCGRKFNDVAFSKHRGICDKVFNSKRKTFDTKKARVQGTEAEMFVKEQQKISGKKGNPPPGEQPIAVKQKATWKSKSNALRDAMQANKMIMEAKKAGKDISSLPMSAPSAPDPSYVQCPTCKRSFNEKAAERHIPKCAESSMRQSFRTGGGSKPTKSKPAVDKIGGTSKPTKSQPPAESIGGTPKPGKSKPVETGRRSIRS